MGYDGVAPCPPPRTPNYLVISEKRRICTDIDTWRMEMIRFLHEAGLRAVNAQGFLARRASFGY